MEMGPLFTNRASVGSGTFNASGYWTSTEYSSSNAQRVDWSNGSVSNNNKNYQLLVVRAVLGPFSISSSSARKINAAQFNIVGNSNCQCVNYNLQELRTLLQIQEHLPQVPPLLI